MSATNPNLALSHVDVPRSTLDTPARRSNGAAPADAAPRGRSGLFEMTDLKIVLLLTLAGAVLRGFMLSTPTIEYDEAATYSRVTGTFRELLDILRLDGFTPLFYELYWVMGKFVSLSPAVMRLPETIAGIAMIPAMYWLAREATENRRVALLSAGLACCSSYLLIFSRFAKMYMPLWLAATIVIAAALWWMRSRGRIARVAWLTWVAAAVAMNGLQALGVIVCAVAVLIILTHPNVTWKRIGLAACGFAISVSGIAIHYAYFNRWAPRVSGAEAGWQESGLTWIQRRNAALNKPFLIFDTATTFLLSYRGPRPPIGPPIRVIVPVLCVGAALAMLLIVGMYPRRLREREDASGGDDPESIAPVPTAPGMRRGGLWIAMWVLLPAYAFYCVSFDDALSPPGMVIAWFSLLGGWWMLLAVAAIAVGFLAARSRMLGRSGLMIFPAILVAPLIFAVCAQYLEPQEFPVLHWWGAIFASRLAVAATLAAFVALMLNWRDRSLASSRRNFLVQSSLLIALCCAIWLATRHPAHDVWNTRYLGIILPAFLIAVAMLIERIPLRALRVLAILLLVIPNLLQYTLRLMVRSNPPLDWIAMDVERAQNSTGRVRTLLFLGGLDPDYTGLEGRGGIFDFPGKYYLGRQLGIILPPPQFRDRDAWTKYGIEIGGKPNLMKALGDHPGVREVVVWRDGDEDETAEIMRAALGPEWSRRMNDTFEIRDYWCWRRTFRCARETFTRKLTPAEMHSRARKAAAAATQKSR